MEFDAGIKLSTTYVKNNHPGPNRIPLEFAACVKLSAAGIDR